MKLSTLTPSWGTQYELLDSGDGQKLERFGAVTTSRPEPQALWRPTLPAAEWQRLADATFSKTKGGTSFDDRGQWSLKPRTPEQWWVKYQSPTHPNLRFEMRLGLTAFKHVGVFPEQAANWEFIYARCRETPNPQVLNLFAYTGGASLAAAAAGATVTHVDSIKQTVSWSRENAERSGFANIRWVVEDALKFTLREVRREKRYNGIILDPPSYGRGANGEKWVLEENILQLLEACKAILEPGGFLILNLYSMGLSAMLAKTLVESVFGAQGSIECGELYFPNSADANKVLPLGIFLRF